MENIRKQQSVFAKSLAAEFGSTSRRDLVYRNIRECNKRKSGGKKLCPVTGDRCKRAYGCKSASFTRSLDGLHGDSTMGEQVL